jgi:hypothetical protein
MYAMRHPADGGDPAERAKLSTRLKPRQCRDDIKLASALNARCRIRRDRPPLCLVARNVLVKR